MRFSKIFSLKWAVDDQGQTLVMTVFCMAVLLGSLGLAVDVGVLLHTRRQMQAAADAAAMAAATEMFYNGYNLANIKAKATAAAQDNLSNAGKTISVAVTPSPTLTPGGTSCASCVQVAVTTPNPTIFMSTVNQWMFKATDFNTINVSAFATAGAPGNSQNCVWLMDPTMDAELALKGKGSISATNCGIYLNSNSASAVYYNGNTSVNAASLNIVGPDTDANGLDPGHVHTGVTPQSPDIPLDLPGIPSSGCTQTSAATEIYPAGSPPKKPKSTQVSDASVSGSSTNNVVCFTGSVTLDDGVVLPGALGNGVLYVFESGVSLGGALQLGSATPDNTTTPPSYKNTYGATLDIAGGGFSQGNAALTIYAPTSGTYNSIALMQPSTNTTDNKCPAAKSGPCLLIQRGNSGSVFDGIVYAPGEYVELQDQAGAVYATGLIAKGLFNKTSNLIINSYSDYNPITTPFKQITLVQ